MMIGLLAYQPLPLILITICYLQNNTVTIVFTWLNTVAFITLVLKIDVVTIRHLMLENDVAALIFKIDCCTP